MVEQRIISRSPWSQINEIDTGLDTLSTHYPFSIEKFQATYFQCQNCSSIKIQNHSTPAVLLGCLIIIQIRRLETYRYLYSYTDIYIHIHVYTHTEEDKDVFISRVLNREVTNAFEILIQ